MPKRSSIRRTSAHELAKNLADDGDLPRDLTHLIAVALGRRGGLKGGKARAKKLSPERRTEIARLAALRRWSKTEEE
jgi:hypothetical protein